MKFTATLFAAFAFGVATLGPAAPALAQTPAATAAATTTAGPPKDFVAKARTLIQNYVAKNQFSGTVLVAAKGKPVFSEGFGFANRELNVKAGPDTVYRIASITKQFTAVAILQLQEQGKLSVDDLVSKYYDKAPPAWSRITIKHLLTHRSGIPSYTDQPSFLTDMRVEKTPEQLVAVTRDMPLQFEPGAQYRYDNSGYILLGWIIEKVSGEKYADYVQKHILDPLGMKRSGYDMPANIIPGRAAGYQVQGDAWINAPYLAMTQLYATGSLYSTTGDLLIWVEGLYADKIMSKASREAMMTDHGNGFGFGSIVWARDSHKYSGHSGNINGFASALTRYVDDKVTIIVLSNLQSGVSDQLSVELFRLYFGIPDPPPPVPLKEVVVKTEVLDRYAGVYEFGPSETVTFFRFGDKIYTKVGRNNVPLTATSETEFHYQPSNIKFVFPPGEGPAPGFTLVDGETETHTRLPGDAGKEPPPLVEVTVKPDVLAQYAGVYELAPGFDITLSVKDGKLYSQATGQGGAFLAAVSEREFRNITTGNKVEFPPGAGPAPSFTLTQGLAPREAKRKP